MRKTFCYRCYKKMEVDDKYKQNKIPIKEIILCNECKSKWLEWKKQRNTKKELV